MNKWFPQCLKGFTSAINLQINSYEAISAMSIYSSLKWTTNYKNNPFLTEFINARIKKDNTILTHLKTAVVLSSYF